MRKQLWVLLRMRFGTGQIAGTKEAGDDPPVRKRKEIYLTEDEVPVRCGCRKMENNNGVNAVNT